MGPASSVAAIGFGVVPMIRILRVAGGLGGVVGLPMVLSMVGTANEGVKRLEIHRRPRFEGILGMIHLLDGRRNSGGLWVGPIAVRRRGSVGPAAWPDACQPSRSLIWTYTSGPTKAVSSSASE